MNPAQEYCGHVKLTGANDSFFATCRADKCCGGKVRKTRTTTQTPGCKAKNGQGRPLGYLVAWLEGACEKDVLEGLISHKDFVPTDAARSAARDRIKANAETLMFQAAEWPKENASDPDEPPVFQI